MASDNELLRESCDQRGQINSGRQIETGEGLIHDENVRIHGDDAHDAKSLLLAFRHFMNDCFGPVDAAKPGEDCAGLFVGLSARRALLTKAECDFFESRGKDNLMLWVLKNKAYFGGQFPAGLRRHKPIDPHLALVGQQQAIDEPEQGAFACAIVPQKAHATL